ncbi:SRPBCC domain-containing protein [Streptomyces sp. NPDC059851]|uniref:SRPBCC family protein n=1 Tax=Streptomyces sp. NPDC059851 TaxID=3346971 RepID=UPI003650F3D1
MTTEPIRVPDLADRPHRLTVERAMLASPHALYRAWTEQFDRWFAAPGSVLMRPEVDAPFFFETEPAGDPPGPGHPHYGRFLRLEPDRLVELTWVTGRAGTAGAETVVTVRLGPHPVGTRLQLIHAGFYDETARDNHASAWPHVLAHQDQVLAGNGQD